MEATFDEWLKAVKSKVTYTRLTRLSVATLVGMKVNDVSLYNKFPYVHFIRIYEKWTESFEYNEEK